MYGDDFFYEMAHCLRNSKVVGTIVSRMVILGTWFLFLGRVFRGLISGRVRVNEVK